MKHGFESGVRQYVYSVTLINRTGVTPVMNGWGPNGAYYFRTTAFQQTFAVNKWVPAGGICARIYWAEVGDSTVTACVSVRP